MRKLKLLMALLALLAGGGNASAYQTPKANGIYYLYNTGCTSGETGFMSTGNSYGFQVVVDKFGFPVKLIDAGNGNFKFQFIHHEGYLSDDGFMYSDGNNTGETPRARTITIQDQGDGKYKLINTSNSKEIENWNGTVVGDGEGNRSDYIWQFLSKTERDAIVAGYTTSVKLAAATSMGMPASVDTEEEFDEYLSTNYAGVDQSSKITNGTFDTSHTTTDWSTTANANRDFNIGWGNQDPKDTPEVYEGAGYLTHSTITVDKVGLYKVSVNATYRCGNSANNNRIGDLGYDGSVAYLKANDNIAKVSDWYSGKINGNGPDSPSEANITYFSAGKYVTEVFVYVGDAKKIDISLHSHAFTWGGWLMFNNFKLTYYSDEVSDADATAILATVDALLEKEMDATIKSNLTSARNTFNGARTIANYNALNALIPDAQASVNAYALFAPERAKALALGITSEAIADLAPNVQALMVAEYNYVTTNYAYGVSLGTWTTTNALERSGQHWDNTSTSTYSEQNEGWGSASWSCSNSQNLTLPAGSYVFKVAGRKSSDAATITLEIKNGNTTLGTVNDFPNGNTGLGINTSGATDFTTGEGHTYANNGVGSGWQWRYVKFVLDEPATVNVAINASANALYQWVGFCNATVQTNNADNVALMEALVALNDAKAAATLTKRTANVGTGVFQVSETENESLWSAYSDAKDDADAFELTSSSTVSDVTTVTSALTSAQTAYSNFLDNPTLNAPDAGKRYILTFHSDGHDANGNAITFIAGGRTGEGDYGLKYFAPSNANLNQAVKFTAVGGETNTYKISGINVADGGERYITTRSVYDDKDADKNIKLRTTDDVDKAVWVKIEATTTSGQFQMRNVTANAIIAHNGNNNNDMFTRNSANFSIAEASQVTVAASTVAADVQYGTRIFPFAPTLPTGVKAYSCEAHDGATLTLVEDETPDANTPYILFAETGCTIAAKTGWGVGSGLEVTKGLLTGVYTDTPAPNGSYVLQNNGKVAFYLVDTKVAKPTVGAYRCYLTVSGEARAAFFFNDDETTGINALNALTSGNATIYDVNGRQVPSLQKGMNIVKANGKSYKVVVK